MIHNLEDILFLSFKDIIYNNWIVSLIIYIRICLIVKKYKICNTIRYYFFKIQTNLSFK